MNYLPLEDTIKFIHRLFELDNLDLSLELSLKEYHRKLVKNLYPKNSPHYNPEILKLIDVFMFDEEKDTALHVITDNTYNMVHINSTDKDFIKEPIRRLINSGYITIPVKFKKNNKIFNFKYYSCYYIGEKPLLPLCSN